MPNYVLSVDMNLPIPIVGVAPGPEYAQDINNCLTIIDQHDHSLGSGVPITPAGLNISSELTFNNQDATNLRSTRFQIQGSPLSGVNDLGCLYVSGVDLYFNDEDGNQIQITQNGGVAGTPGSISNLVPPASAAYVSGSTKFVWKSSATQAADMDAGSLTIRKLTANSNGITISAPSALSSDYTLTLPALPGSQLPMTLDASGNMGTSQITQAMLDPTIANSINPAGTILTYGGTSAPTGYLLCDGSAVSRTTYSGLFAVIGTSFGSGNGSTTFNVPDFRGRFLRGWDDGAGRDPDASSRTAMNSGGATGDNIGSVQDDAFESHSHDITWIPNVAITGTGSGGVNAFWDTRQSQSANTGLIANTGGNETRPINAYINFIIKT